MVSIVTKVGLTAPVSTRIQSIAQTDSQISCSSLSMKILMMTIRKKVSKVDITDFSVFQYKFYPNP